MELCGVLGAQEDYKAALEECEYFKERVSQLKEQLLKSREAERGVEKDLRVEMKRQHVAMDYRSVFLIFFLLNRKVARNIGFYQKPTPKNSNSVWGALFYFSFSLDFCSHY